MKSGSVWSGFDGPLLEQVVEVVLGLLAPGVLLDRLVPLGVERALGTDPVGVRVEVEHLHRHRDHVEVPLLAAPVDGDLRALFSHRLPQPLADDLPGSPPPWEECRSRTWVLLLAHTRGENWIASIFAKGSDTSQLDQ